MRLRQHITFTGGIELPEEKRVTRTSAIARAPLPSLLHLPLTTTGGPPPPLLVREGDRVAAGQRLAGGDGDGDSVRAPLPGRIGRVTTVSLAGRGRFVRTEAIELTPECSSPTTAAIPPASEKLDWQAESPRALRRRVSGGGLTTCRLPTTPVTAWIDTAREKACRTLIANGMENEPFVTADHRLLIEQGRAVVIGLAVLARCIEAETVLLAADQRRVANYRGLVGPSEDLGIERIALPHKYPIGADPMLARIITGRECPPGGSVMDVGAAVVCPSTCFAVYRWVVCGTPPAGRVVTRAGPAAGARGNVWAWYGTHCRELLDTETDALAIHGGPMTGLALPDDAVVGPSTNALLSFPQVPPEAPAPCVRCGWCTDHCPSRLNVAKLNDLFELGDFQEAGEDGALACMDCGVCSYVCPSRLPLTQRVKMLKSAIRAHRRRLAAVEAEGGHAP